jgi:hypothetical protein
MKRRCGRWPAGGGLQGGKRRNAIGLQVGTGQDRHHAVDRARLGGVERADPRMRVRRPHEHRVQRTGPLHIIDEAALPRQQPVVLAPRDRLSDAELHHGFFRWLRMSMRAMREHGRKSSGSRNGAARRLPRTANLTATGYG